MMINSCVSLSQSGKGKDMDYIRTEDGHIYSKGDNIPSTSVVAISSNLEELCDEFVMEERMSGTNKAYSHLVYSYDNWKHYVFSGDSDEIEMEYEGQPLKGAIWTNGGLIYVMERTKEGTWKIL